MEKIQPKKTGAGESGVKEGPPKGHESEVNMVIMKLEDLARTVAGDTRVTEEMLDKDWPIWGKRVEQAAKIFAKDAKDFKFSWDPQVIDYIRETAAPLPKAIFKKFRGILTDRDIKHGKLMKEVGG